MSSDIEIARKANMEPIMDIGTKLDIPFKALRPFGHFKAKLSPTWFQNQSKNLVNIGNSHVETTHMTFNDIYET